MVVLENGPTPDHLASASASARMQHYLASQYVQPLPHEEMDSKVSPLAMLTQACNKIESNMMGSAALAKTSKPSPTASVSSTQSPKRARSESGESASPSNKQARTSPLGSAISQPLASSEKRKTPERRPSSTSVSSMSSASPMTSAAVSTTSAPGALGHPFGPYPGLGHFAARPPFPPMASPHPPTSCSNAMCTDFSCPTGMARAALLMGVPPSLGLLNYFHPGMAPPPSTSTASATATGASSFVCNWMSGGEFCGRRFNSSEDLMGHLRTHTSPSTPSSSTTTTTPTLAALQAAQSQALLSPVSGASALAALQAQAAKMAATPSVTPPTTTAADLAAAAAARYYSSFVARPGAPPPPPPHPMGFPPLHSLPPHLASLYGLGSPYGFPHMVYP